MAKKQSVKGGQKGAEFERTVCKDLSAWVSDRKRKDLFWRTAMSGGRATLSLEGNEAHAGDVSATHRDGHPLLDRFVIECKSYRSIDVQPAFYGKGGKLLAWWDKLCALADEINKEPLLIAKQNMQPVLCCVRTKGLKLLKVGETKRHSFEPWATCPRVDMNVCLYRDLLKLSYTKLGPALSAKRELQGKKAKSRKRLRKRLP